MKQTLRNSEKLFFSPKRQYKSPKLYTLGTVKTLTAKMGSQNDTFTTFSA